LPVPQPRTYGASGIWNGSQRGIQARPS
jgi:hypothetical protein